MTVAHPALVRSGLPEYDPPPENGARTSLQSWAQDATAAAQIARALAGTAFISESLQVRRTDNTLDFDRTASTTLGVILAGTELGLSPMAALRSIDIIKGTPAMRAIAMRALVQSAGHTLMLVESTETRAIMRGRRRGESEWQTSTWTIDRAKRLQLTGRPNWQRQPQAMLIARATGECARLVAADVLLGLPYAVEEIEDDLAGAADTNDAAQSDEQPATRTAQRKRVPRREPAREPSSVDIPAAPLPEPELAPPGAVPEPEVEPVDARQLTALHAALNELGIRDRDAGLAYLSAAVDREVSTSKELTRDECSDVLRQIRADVLAAQADIDEPNVEES